MEIIIATLDKVPPSSQALRKVLHIDCHFVPLAIPINLPFLKERFSSLPKVIPLGF